uniref:Single-stranded-DNA-specific exonuclease RecJ n=1 Tax=candidate division WOR-3 bacterium TaxID=2052148 RepID=A0A7C3N7E8_UNCW3
MIYNWVYKEVGNDFRFKDLAKDFNTDEYIIKILINRGIEPSKIGQFLNPDEKNFYDPFLMKGMKDSVVRIKEAIERKENILIYGDYDADGITSTAMLYRFFKMVGLKPYFFIPHRLEEGYGVSRNGIDFALSKNVSLMITVDCGITAFEEIEYAKRKGLDIIVTDHHEFADKLPAAYSIVNPNREDETYPFKSLAGCGVVFKLIQALDKFIGVDFSVIDNFIDFVTLGTIADVVPLIDENRTIASIGLKHLKNVKNYGIKSLIEVSDLKLDLINSYHVGFILAPRINAMGRMDNATKAVNLLITDDKNEAEELAKELNKKNRLRQEVDQDVFDEAVEMIEKDSLHKKQTIVIAKENWHEGVIGIVASRLVEKYNKPTIMISIVDDVGKGSGRSTQNFHLYNALKELEDVLLSFGGHRLAAGITLKRENIEEFKIRFEEYAKLISEGKDYEKNIDIDCVLPLDRIDHDFYEKLEKLEPFGYMNPQPVFLSKNVDIVGYPLMLKDKHLRLCLKQKEYSYDAIWFNNGKEMMSKLTQPGKQFDVVYNIMKNEYSGKILLQLRIIDIMESA